MSEILILSLTISVLSFILTYFIIRVALKHKILDIPNERSSHNIPTPRGGGLAIVISWFIGITVLRGLDLIERDLFFALLSGILLAIVSLIDDVVSLPPYIRLTVQLVTTIISLWFLNGINSISFAGLSIDSIIVLYPIVLIGIVWFINLFNFLDGIDAYASLEAIVIALAIYIFTGNVINLILICSISGFLFWNWPKARIFMGDIGSTQLGFVLVILGIYFHNTSQLSIIYWIMLSSLFWFDATLTLFRRWKNREKLSVAHRKHAYQRAVQSGLSHQNTILLSLLVNTIIIGFVIIVRKQPGLIVPVFLINILFLWIIVKIIDRRVPFL